MCHVPIHGGNHMRPAWKKKIFGGQMLIHLEYLYGCLTLQRAIIFTGTAPNAPLSQDHGAAKRNLSSVPIRYFYIVEYNGFGSDGAHLLAHDALGLLGPWQASSPVDECATHDPFPFLLEVESRYCSRGTNLPTFVAGIIAVPHPRHKVGCPYAFKSIFHECGGETLRGALLHAHTATDAEG